jgi:phage gpG-like protein
MIQVELIGIDDALRAMKGFSAALNTVLKDADFLNDVGVKLFATAKENLLESGGLDTKPFRPLKPETVRAKTKKGQTIQPLIASGELLRSIGNSTVRVSDGNLSLEAIYYLKYHQFDDDRKDPDNFPARPVFIVTDDDTAFISEVIADNLKKTLR